MTLILIAIFILPSYSKIPKSVMNEKWVYSESHLRISKRIQEYLN